MHDICKEAGISPGALYVYFASKEDLIAGLAERDRAEFQERFAPIGEATDILGALQTIGEQYFVDEPTYKSLMCIEIGVESTRNKKIGEIYRSVDSHVYSSLRELFERLHQQGRIAPTLDTATVVELVAVIGDGLMWRRAVDPDFKPDKLMDAVTALVGSLINPTGVDADVVLMQSKGQATVAANVGTIAHANASTTGESGALTAPSDIEAKP